MSPSTTIRLPALAAGWPVQTTTPDFPLNMASDDSDTSTTSSSTTTSGDGSGNGNSPLSPQLLSPSPQSRTDQLVALPRGLVHQVAAARPALGLIQQVGGDEYDEFLDKHDDYSSLIDLEGEEEELEEGDEIEVDDNDDDVIGVEAAAAGGVVAVGGSSRVSTAISDFPRRQIVRRTLPIGEGGGKKGKLAKAVELPVEVILNILYSFLETLYQDEWLTCPTFRHDTGRRWTILLLRIRRPVAALRRISRAWRYAVDQLDIWHFIAARILHLPRNVNPSFRRFGSFIHQSCWVCLLADGRRIKTELFEYSSAGLVPVCKFHAAGFCGRCLAGPTGRASPQLSLQPASNEAALWGSDDALSCFDCRRDVLDLALERRGPDGPIRSDDDPAHDLYWSYIHDGEQEVEQAVLAIFERRWLARHTNFPEIVQQILESRALIERRPSRMTPADKRLMLHHMQAEIHGLEGGDDLLGDELDAMDADAVEDDDELLESDESDEALSSYELRQVLDMSIQAWMGERVLNGAWLSPAELLSHHNLWLASRARGEPPAAPVARGRAAANEQYCPFMLVQRPLLPFTERTSEHDPHPLPRDIHAVPPPPTDSVIITSMSEAYGREMRRILLPAMTQIVRHLETRRYPIAEATSLSAEAVIDLLRLPQAWIEGGMNAPAAGKRSQDLSHTQRPPQPRRSSGEDATSHSPSPSATDTSQSISTPPQSTSPGRSLSLLPPPDSPRKPPAVLLEGLPHRGVAHPPPVPPTPLALASQLPTTGAAGSAARPPPPPLRRSSEPPLVPFRPVEPVPCIPHAGAPLGSETLAIIGSIWYEAWEPLRTCKCGICVRGMAMAAAAVAVSNSNGKRKEGSGGGGGNDRVESMQGVLGVIDASGREAGEEEEGNAKRARTEPPV